MQNPTIIYVDDPKVKILFGTLIVDVEKITENFGSLAEFDRRFRPGGHTNGKLFFMHEMRWPPEELLEKREEWFAATGMRPGIDGSVMQERQGKHPGGSGEDDSCLFLGLPECRSAKFMRTLLTYKGCYAWHHTEVGQEYYSPQRGQYLLEKYLLLNEPHIMTKNPKCTAIDDEKIEYTVYGMVHHVLMEAILPVPVVD